MAGLVLNMGDVEALHANHAQAGSHDLVAFVSGLSPTALKSLKMMPRTMPDKVIHFKVDEEHCTTTEPNLTVHQILELGKKKPANEYYITRKEQGKDVDYKDQTKVVTVHEGDHFHAVFTGDMTTS